MKQVIILLLGLSLLLTCAACDGKSEEAAMQPTLTIIRLNGKYGFLDAQGKLVITPRFDEVYDFCDGVAPARQGALWGLLDGRGDWLTEPRFADVGLGGFHNGYLAASDGRGWGAVDKTGQWAVQPLLPEPPEFDERGLARVGGSNASPSLINRRGEPQNCEPLVDLSLALLNDYRGYYYACALAGGGLYVAQGEAFGDKYFHDRALGLHCVRAANGLYGLLDERGNWAAEPAFAEILPFKNGLAAAQSSKTLLWGLINAKGEWILKARFNETRSPETGGAAVARLGSWGLIGLDGLWRAEAIYSDIYEFHGGLAVFELNGKFGFLDEWGQVAIEPRFDWLSRHGKPFAGQDLAVAGVGHEENRRYGLINRAGDWVLAPEYLLIADFLEREGCTGGMDEQRRAVIINAKGEAVAWVAREEGLEVLRDMKGQTLWP